jgi:general stress protein 26
MSRRAQIAMSRDEVDHFLDQQRVVICATLGPRGWPHVMPLWYVVREGQLWAWTYAKSQKVRNLERDSRATLQLEEGDRYEDLRGVMIEADTVLHRDTDRVADVGAAILARYGPNDAGAGFKDAIRAQAAKRVALQFRAARVASWDHGKLGGVY